MFSAKRNPAKSSLVALIPLLVSIAPIGGLAPDPEAVPFVVRELTDNYAVLLAGDGPDLELRISGRWIPDRFTFMYIYRGPGVEPRPFLEVEYKLKYTPTMIAHIDRNTILVAGKRDDGRTVFERWTIPKATLIECDGEPALNAPICTQREIVLDAKLKEGTHVEEMFVALGTSGARRVFLLFRGGRTLYSLDLKSTSLSPVASGDKLSGVLHVPNLSSSSIAFVVSQECAGAGYLYHLHPGCVVGPESLYLVDEDKDGTIDSYDMVTEKEWESRNWSNANKWTSFEGTVP